MNAEPLTAAALLTICRAAAERPPFLPAGSPAALQVSASRFRKTALVFVDKLDAAGYTFDSMAWAGAMTVAGLKLEDGELHGLGELGGVQFRRALIAALRDYNAARYTDDRNARRLVQRQRDRYAAAAETGLGASVTSLAAVAAATAATAAAIAATAAAARRLAKLWTAAGARLATAFTAGDMPAMRAAGAELAELQQEARAAGVVLGD